MLVSRVRRTIAERELLGRGNHVLVACSGGADSVALLHVLHTLRRELGVTLVLASIDHGLREEAAEEVQGVGRFAESLGVPFVTRRLCVATETNSAGLPALAREARYAALHDLAQEQGAGLVAVGHTRNDQAETVLARLLRGSGLRGLSGIAPRRDDGVIRPLIDCQREQVRAYAAHHDLPFVDDPTNADVHFERARIRHTVIPLLLKEDPQVIKHLAAIADEAATTATLIDNVLHGAPDTASRVQPIEIVASLPAAITAPWMSRWLENHTGRRPERRHLEAACRLLRAEGEVLLGSGWQVSRQNHELVLENLTKRPRS